MKRHKLWAVVTGTLLIAAILGCGSGTEDAPDPSEADTAVLDSATEAANAESAPGSVLSPEAREIQEALNSAIVRLKYGDKSGLYENEFEYLTDEKNFDEYLEYEPVRYARADSIDFIEVTGYEPREYNSIMVDVIVHFLGPTGVRTDFPDRVRMFRHKDRWIKPTVSKLTHQLEYENILRQADSAAEAEADWE
ncbi:MAG: hypothetical protein OEW00_07785 [candidate division Zixibacteria bacterium]|nr:hypothetical protein [candidate division Zixibacteria bacterium]